MTTKYNRDESLSKSIKTLVIKESFYGLFIITLDKQWTDKINTTGVGRHGIGVRLYINELFWESLKEIWRLYALKHDIN